MIISKREESKPDLVKRRISLGDIAIAGAIFGAAAAILLFASNFTIGFDEETQRWILQKKEEAFGIIGKAIASRPEEAEASSSQA
jgi:hypothetical protein